MTSIIQLHSILNSTGSRSPNTARKVTKSYSEKKVEQNIHAFKIINGYNYYRG